MSHLVVHIHQKEKIALEIASKVQQKDHEDQAFFLENILHFVWKCTKHHKYAESQMASCAL